MTKRALFIGIAFASVELTPAILMLIFGLTGATKGNSFVTGGFIVGGIVLLAISAFRRMPSLGLLDILFVSFVAAVVASFAINPVSADRNEIILLILSLSSYIAARGITQADLPAIRNGTLWVAGSVVAISLPFAIMALITQSHAADARAIVFDMQAAGTLFTGCLGLLAISAACTWLDRRSTAIWCALLFAPCAIYAATYVRFSLVAMVAATALALLLRERKQRPYVVILLLTMILAIGCGLAANREKTIFFGRHVLQSASEEHAEGPKLAEAPNAAAAPVTLPASTIPSCNINIDWGNTIAQRRALIDDAVSMFPGAGLLGSGLDSFAHRSCMAMWPHNDVLQTTVEFGWIGGASFTLLLFVATIRLFPLVRLNRDAAFLMCSLAFVVALSMAHGRISREGSLFLLLGAAAGVTRRPASSRP